YDSYLYCLDATTGASNWVYQTGNGVNGTPAVFQGMTALGGCDAMLHFIALTNGTKIKEVEIGAPMLASVAVADGRAYAGHYENAVVCVDIAKGTSLWTYQARAFPYISSAAVSGDRIVIGGRDKRLHCINRETGKEIWTFATRGKVDSSPAIASDKVVVGSDDGRVYLVKLSDGKELWNYEIGQPVESSPAVADGRFVVGSN